MFKRSRTRTRKTPYKKRRVSRLNQQLPRRTQDVGDLLPVLLKTQLTYHQTVVLPTTISVGTTQHNFRLGSLFDPDYTTTGHQPYGFDQLAAFYSRYYVTGARMYARFVTSSPDNESTSTGPMLVGVTSKQTITFPSTDPDTWAEHPLTQSRLQAVDENSTELMCQYDPTMVGYTKEDRSNISSVGGNPPSSDWFGTVWVWNTGNTAATNTICHVRIEYDCEFSRPNTMSPS